MSDAVFTIREESTTTILKLSEKFYGKDWLMDIIDRKLDELVKHERFMLRIQSIHLINKMWEVVSDDYVNRRFAEILIEMTTDPVPNIRFNVCKTLLAVYPRLSAQNKERVVQALEKLLEVDTDFDSKFYAEKGLF